MLKRVVVILLCVFIAIDAGLLIYGAIGTMGRLPSDLKGAYVEPDASVREYSVTWNASDVTFSSQISKGDPIPWNEMSDIYASDMSAADKAATMFVCATYNQIYAARSAHKVTTSVYSPALASTTEILWVQQGFNRFYQSLSHNIVDYGHRMVNYYDQKLDVKTFNGVYDADTKSFNMSWGAFSDVTQKVKYKAAYTSIKPSATSTLFNFPLSFVGECRNEWGVDASLIDAASVAISLPNALKPYYTVTFKADVKAINDSVESKENIIDASGGKSVLQNPIFSDLSVVFTIWSETGLFRDVVADITFSGEVLGKNRRAADVHSEIVFSYDEEDANVPRWIEDVNATDKLTDANIIKLQQEIVRKKENNDE